MGRVRMTRVYLDANLVVYLVENTPKAAMVRHQLLQLNNPQPYSSDLALCECLVMPLRTNNPCSRLGLRTVFQGDNACSQSSPVFRLAAELRAHSALRTPDALHLALCPIGSVRYFSDGRPTVSTKLDIAAIALSAPSGGYCVALAPSPAG